MRISKLFVFFLVAVNSCLAPPQTFNGDVKETIPNIIKENKDIIPSSIPSIDDIKDILPSASPIKDNKDIDVPTANETPIPLPGTVNNLSDIDKLTSLKPEIPVPTTISTAITEFHDDSPSPSVDLSSLKNETVVFNSSIFGLKDIYVFNGDSSNLRKITFPSFLKVEQASVSATENNIIFTGDGTVYTVDIDGNWLLHIRSNTVTEGSISYPVFSPDVKKILYTVRKGTAIDIFTSAYHGSNYQYISGSNNDRDASFSPDSKKIVYVEGNTKLKIMDADGNNKVQVYTGRELSFPIWSPDGSKIAFIQKESITSSNLYTINVNGTALANLTNNLPVSVANIGRVLKWSKDSQKIFYTGKTLTEGVFVTNSDGSAYIHLPLNFATAKINSSLTGKMMYVSDKEGTPHTYLKTLDNNQEVEISETPARFGKIFYNRNYLLFAGTDGIYWAPDNSTVMTKIPNTTADSMYPEWTPDGRIIFNQLGGSTAYLSTLDGSSIIGIPLGNPKNGHFEMSSDGNKVVYTSIKAAEVLQNIYTMNGDTSNKVQLTTAGNNSFPSWSFDSKKIIFDSDRTGQKEIFIMNSDGTGQTALTNFGAYEPKWSPDGKKIAFTTEKDGKKSIYVMNIDGTLVEKLFGDNMNNYYLNHWK